jgi:hypothetical protein
MAATFTVSLTVVAGLSVLSLPPAVGLAALAVGTVIGAWAAPRRTALGCGLIAWLFEDGFVEHSLGTLGFRVGSDLPAIAVLLLAALLGSAAGRGKHVGRSSTTNLPRTA